MHSRHCALSGDLSLHTPNNASKPSRHMSECARMNSMLPLQPNEPTACSRD